MPSRVEAAWYFLSGLFSVVYEYIIIGNDILCTSYLSLAEFYMLTNEQLCSLRKKLEETCLV